MTAQKRVVIAGGGIAGAQLVAKLQDKAEIILIDPKEFFEVPMAAPREMVHPEFSEEAVIPYAEFLTEGEHIRGKVVNVAAAQVSVETADAEIKQVPYDFLVLATGSKYRSGLVKAHDGTVKERRAHYEKLQNQIGGAQRILIIGGGPVGVEISAEILETFPQKNVTLLHSGPRLLNASSERAAAKAATYLRGKGAEIIFDEKVIDNRESEVVEGPGAATTDKDRKIDFDLLLWCVGAKHDTSYMTENFHDVLDENGRIKVEGSLLVEGQSNIFALGDVTALNETKLAAWTTMHVPVVIKNLLALLENGQTDRSKLKQWKTKTGNELMLVALGPHHGVGSMPWGSFLGDTLAKRLKAPKMLVPMYRKNVGVGKAK